MGTRDKVSLMARFKGTIQEFYKFIEPRIRNVINTFAKMERLKHKGDLPTLQ